MLRHLLLELLQGHVGTSVMGHVQKHLLAVQQPVGDKFACSNRHRRHGATTQKTDMFVLLTEYTESTCIIQQEYKRAPMITLHNLQQLTSQMRKHDIVQNDTETREPAVA